MDEPILKSGQWPNIAIDPATGKHAATGEEIERGTKMTDSRTTLLPCPFCGGEAQAVNSGPWLRDHFMWFARCSDCVVSTPYKPTEAEAIAAWNTRATHGSLTAEQVREAIERNFGKVAVLDDGKPVEWRDDWVCKVGIDYRAIADELNTRAERTCRVKASYDTADVDNRGSNAEWYFAFTCGCELYWDEPEPPSYCPNCGARVEVES